MLEIPSKIIALLCEFNDDTTKSARYVRSWPPAVEPVTKKEYEDFYERIGEGDVRLGQERVTEDGKLDPREFIFFEPEEPEICINPQNIFDLNKFSSQYEKLLRELEPNGRLSLSKAFAYLLRKARIMRYQSCFLMLMGLKNYYWHIFCNTAASPSPGLNGPNDEESESKDLNAKSNRQKKKSTNSNYTEPRRGLHMPMKSLVEACLELEMWLHRQQGTYNNDREKAEHLITLLDPKLVNLLDEQLNVLQKELLLRSVDIFDYPDWYMELSDQYLENVREEARLLGFSQEELSGPFPRPVCHLGLEDECRQSLYRRIVSQAIDSYFYNDWNARMELWAFQRKSPPVGGFRKRERGERTPPCMKFIASKPMGDLTDTVVPEIVYIATEVGVKLIAIKKQTFLV